MRSNRSQLVFTVDVEADWAGTETRGIREALPRLLDLLDRYDARATFFVVGALVDEVRPLLPSGSNHEVGSHGLTHQLLSRMSRAEALREVAESKLRLEEAGYTIEGFRAPFFAAPSFLPEVLAEAGYAYDASLGGVNPSLKNRRFGRALVHAGGALPRVANSVMVDGLTPFSLTWLRLYQPFSLSLEPIGDRVFYCHLHEFLDNTPGWSRLPTPFRQLHRRGSGAGAWRIVERLLASARGSVVPCRDLLKANEFAYSNS